jgi:hypothetical protein
MYVDVILSKIFDTPIKKHNTSYEVVANNNKYNCPYKYSDFHLEIDIHQIVSAERQFISEFISNHIAKTKNITQQKHVIVMHNINSLNEQSMFALRYPIERLCKNVIFIFTAQYTSPIEPAFLSRCLLLRSNIEDEDMEEFFEYFISQNNIDPTDGITKNIHKLSISQNNIEDPVEIDPSDGIIKNILKLSKYNVENNIEKQLHLFIDQLLKEKNIFKACELIKSFGFKILHFNIPIANIMKITLDYLCNIKSFQKHLYYLIQFSADLEYKSTKISKYILVFERYFIEIYKKHTLK